MICPACRRLPPRYLASLLILLLATGCDVSAELQVGGDKGRNDPSDGVPTRLPKNPAGIAPDWAWNQVARGPMKVITPIPDEFDTDVLCLGADERIMAKLNALNQSPYRYEVWRQALLIAAEHELGLVTRDSAMRGAFSPEDRRKYGEIRIRGNSSHGVKFVYLDEGTSLRSDSEGLVLAQSGNLGIPSAWGYCPKQPIQPTKEVYPLILDVFPEILKGIGYEGEPLARNFEGEVPGEVEDLLKQMQLVPQFEALRRLEQIMRTEGESPAVLGAIARCHANLGVLTTHFWRPNFHAHMARAMLYAERLRLVWKDTVPVRWDRSYVYTVLGMHRLAIYQLGAIEKRTRGKSSERPWYAEFLLPGCQYKVDKLLELADAAPGDDKQVPYLLAVLAAEGLEGEDELERVISRVEPALPGCARVHTMARLCGSIGQAAHACDAMLDAMLPGLNRQIEAATGLPAVALRDLSVPLAVEDVPKLVDRLAQAGAPSVDALSFSWDMLAAMIEDDSFSRIMAPIARLRGTYGRPPEATRELVEEYGPILKSHPYRAAAEMLSVEPTEENLGPLQDRFRFPMVMPAMSEFAAAGYEWSFPPTAWGPHMLRNSMVPTYHCTELAGPSWFSQIMVWRRHEYKLDPRLVRTRLYDMSPHHPTAQLTALVADYQRLKYEKPELIEANLDSPMVAGKVAEEYLANREYDKATEVYRRLAEATGNSETRLLVAQADFRRGDLDSAGKVGQDIIARSTNQGLQPAFDAGTIAREYCRLHRFEEAAPFARAAASTGAGEGLLVAGNVFGQLGRWDEFDQLLGAGDASYGTIYWYYACKAFGHGDTAAARRMAERNVRRLRVASHGHERCRAAFFLLLEGRSGEALEPIEDYLSAARGGLPGADHRASLSGAVLADPKTQGQVRDRCLADLTCDRLPEVTRGKDERLVGKALADYLADGDRKELDTDYLDGILAEATNPNAMAALTAMFCEKYTTKEQTIRFAKKSLLQPMWPSTYEPLACDLLRRNGIDPKDAIASPVWTDCQAGRVDEITVELSVMGTVELSVLPEGLQLLAIDGPPSSVRAAIDGETWELRWTEPASPGSEFPVTRSSLFPMDIGIAAFDVECVIRDQRQGSPSERPCRIVRYPMGERMRVAVTDQQAGCGWYTLKLTRRKDHKYPWPTGQTLLVNTLRKDFDGKNPLVPFRSPEGDGKWSVDLHLGEVGKRTVLRAWLARRKGVEPGGIISLTRPGDENLVHLIDISKVKSLPTAEEFDGAKRVEVDITKHIKYPGWHNFPVSLRTFKQEAKADLWRLEIRTFEDGKSE